MATYSKHLLSGSTGGRPIKLNTNPVTIHTTGISSATIDEVWLYATNTTTSDVPVVIYFGGSTNPDDYIRLTVPAEDGLYLVVPGIPLTGDGASGRSVQATATLLNVINFVGYINRITP